MENIEIIEVECNIAFPKYDKDTQKWKAIQILILKNKACEDYEVEKFKDIWIGSNAWSRLSELLKEGVVTATYYDNPNRWKHLWYKRAIYKLTPEAQAFYKQLYNIKPKIL
jgi:hypothetical protein